MTAKRCRHCGELVDPELRAEIAEARTERGRTEKPADGLAEARPVRARRPAYRAAYEEPEGSGPRRPGRPGGFWDFTVKTLWRLGVAIAVLIAVGAVLSTGGRQDQGGKEVELPAGRGTTGAAAAPSAAYQNAPLRSAVGLMAEYQENELAADRKYKGTLVRVTGDVKSVNRSTLGEIYVELAAEEGRHPFRTVRCEFSDGWEGKLVGLRVGDRATFTGQCKGLITRSTITLEDCQPTPPS